MLVEIFQEFLVHLDYIYQKEISIEKSTSKSLATESNSCQLQISFFTSRVIKDLCPYTKVGKFIHLLIYFMQKKHTISSTDSMAHLT